MMLDDACAWFDLDAADTAEVIAAAEQITNDATLSARAATVERQLGEHLGLPTPWTGVDAPGLFDPMTEPNASAGLRWFYAVAYARFLPTVLEFQATRGVPEQVSRATFADVGRHVRIARRKFGTHACYEQHWLTAHMQGILYDLGRLQFNLARLTLSQEELDEAGIDATPGTVVVETHIPETGPLGVDAVDASFGRAQAFFSAHFPELGTIRYATCESWLLDPQLGDIVPGSNIARFGARYSLFRTAHESDQSALDFVFRAPTTPRERLPRDTRLQRGLLDHLAAGRHIESRYGWLELPRATLSTD